MTLPDRIDINNLPDLPLAPHFKVFDSNGNLIPYVKAYNPKTQEAYVCARDTDGRIIINPLTKEVVYRKVKLPGSTIKYKEQTIR